jgi:beta-glucosidase
LHHFSSPKWLISEGGWESETTVEYFGEYSKFVTSELGHLIPYICTINEANMGIQIKRVMEDMMSQMKGEAKPENGDVQVGLNMDMKKKWKNITVRRERHLELIHGMSKRFSHPELKMAFDYYEMP